MIFYKKTRLLITFRKTWFFISLLLCGLFEFMLFILSIGNGSTPKYTLILQGLVFLGLYAAIFAYNLNSNEYRELIRQAKCIGDLDYVGNTIENLKKIPVKRGVLKFNEKLIFYSDSENTKIILPSKITEITASSYFDRRMIHNVYISYSYENFISIESFTKEASGALCEELKRTVAPHLLSNETSDID